MNRRRRTWLLVAGILVILSTGVEAAKPGPKPPPPPPPPPADPTLIYEWREDLGGWLDTQSNLVWGYSIIDLRGTSQHSGYGINHATAVTSAANYATILADMIPDLEAAAAQAEAQGDYQTQQGDAFLAAGDVATAERWYAAAAANYARAQVDLDSIPAYFDAAVLASQYSNWRLPTQQEAQTAVANGLFTYGTGGFNAYDGSPRIDLQIPWNVLTWSSTLSKNQKDAWAYRPLDGSNGFVGRTGSAINCIFVRSHVP